MNINNNNIIAITVTYNPNLKLFKNVIDRIIENFNNILIINNSPKLNMDFINSRSIKIINNDQNVGLSLALNIGIDYAKKKGFKFISFFDQDTLIGFDYLDKMIFYSNKLFKTEKCIIAPIYKNLLSNELSKLIKLKSFTIERSKIIKMNDLELADYVITSGSIIPISIINHVGNMNEKLFIDFIDIEWCLRARMKGYNIYLLNKVLILQRLGDFVINVFGTKYILHSPLRTYYFFRNAIYLYLYSNLPINWRIADFFRNILRLFFYIFFISNRLTYLSFIFSGIYDGIRSKMYKKSD